MEKQQPLEEILRQAYLLSDIQVQEAIRERSRHPERQIGEIIVERGWLKQSTVDFFAEQWKLLVSQGKDVPKHPLGYYLQQADLLDEAQIATILAEQDRGRMWFRLGVAAVTHGWLNIGTIDFFIEHLYPEHSQKSPFVKPNSFS
jgi:hypothetical protein